MQSYNQVTIKKRRYNPIVFVIGILITVIGLGLVATGGIFYVVESDDNEKCKELLSAEGLEVLLDDCLEIADTKWEIWVGMGVALLIIGLIGAIVMKK